MSVLMSLQSIVDAFVNAPACSPELVDEIARTAYFDQGIALAALAAHPELHDDQFVVCAAAGILCEDFDFQSDSEIVTACVLSD